MDIQQALQNAVVKASEKVDVKGVHLDVDTGVQIKGVNPIIGGFFDIGTAEIKQMGKAQEVYDFALEEVGGDETKIPQFLKRVRGKLGTDADFERVYRWITVQRQAKKIWTQAKAIER